jgi:hypothetical protein
MQATSFSTIDTPRLPFFGPPPKDNETLPVKKLHKIWFTFLLLYPFSWSPTLTTEVYFPEILEKIVPLSRPSPSFETYMKLVNTWANAFDEEATVYATEDLESLYDDAYFEAMELQKKLP